MLKLVDLAFLRSAILDNEAVSVVVVVDPVLLIISDGSSPEVLHIIQVRISVKHASSKTQLCTY